MTSASRRRSGTPASNPRRSKEWTQFEARLAKSLPALEEDHFLILSDPKTDHFIQFAGSDGHGIRGEAKSNNYIAPRRQLSPDQERRLIELGWKAPTHKSDSSKRKPGGSPNWYQDWGAPVRWATVAQVAGLTLREVYAVRHPSSLEYRAFESEGTPLLLPMLGIKRSKRESDSGPIRVEWRAELKRAVERTLLPQLTSYAIRRSKDGDLVTASRRAIVRVREKEDPFQILFFAQLLGDIVPAPKVLEALNERNAKLLLGRLFAVDNDIWLDQVIPAEPFMAEHFLSTLAKMHRLAARLSAELQVLLGGGPTQPTE